MKDRMHVPAECSNAQGKFWPMHDKLYVAQITWANQVSTAVRNTFKQYAVTLGLNAASFNSCLDSSKYYFTGVSVFIGEVLTIP